MLSSKLLFLLFLPFSFVSPERESDPPEVVLTLINGEEFSGEILSVRDRTVILSTIYGASEDMLERMIHKVIAMELDSIKQLKVRGKSYVVTGMGVGGGIGALTGGVIGVTQEIPAIQNNNSRESWDYSIDPVGCGGWLGKKLENGVLGCAIGTGVGMFLGASVGAAFSGRDSILLLPTAIDAITLKTLSRYQDEEPEFIKAIGK